MNKFFQSAIKRFDDLLPKNKKSGFLINPISKEDSEIINELKVIIKKAGLNEVSEILKNYKEYKDSEIFDSLLQWNIDHPNLKVNSNGENIEENNFRRIAFLKIKEVIISQFDLKGFKLIEEVKDGDIEFSLMLNPTPEEAHSIPYFSNYIVKFADEEDRDNTINQLKSFFDENNIDILEL